MQLILPAARFPGAEQLGELNPVVNTYVLRTIIAAAILEGAAFFNLAAYLVEGSSLSLILAAILVALIVAHFPTRAALEDWVERELNTIDQLRQMRTFDAR